MGTSAILQHDTPALSMHGMHKVIAPHLVQQWEQTAVLWEMGHTFAVAVTFFSCTFQLSSASTSSPLYISPDFSSACMESTLP